VHVQEILTRRRGKNSPMRETEAKDAVHMTYYCMSTLKWETDGLSAIYGDPLMEGCEFLDGVD
jgi:hypothetical protein